MPLVYLNGEILPSEDAKVSVDDRGFLFADGIYEVMKLQDGFVFTADEHFGRLRRGLAELRIPAEKEAAELPSILSRLVEANGYAGQECYCYIQITRGSAAPRAHAWHGGPVVPTVYVRVNRYTWPNPSTFSAGMGAIAVPDGRWNRCDIKTVSLLPNILANQRAKEAGCYEALLLRPVDALKAKAAAAAAAGGAGAGENSGMAIVEASHSNVFAVMREDSPSGGYSGDGGQGGGQVVGSGVQVGGGGVARLRLVSPAEVNILPGVTRRVVLERGPKDAALCAAAASAGCSDPSLPGGLALGVGVIPYAGIADGTVVELFVTASTSFVVPIVSVDGMRVGDGTVGPVTTAVREAWLRWWEEDRAKALGALAGAGAVATETAL